MRASLLLLVVGAFGLLGCVSFPTAHLRQGQAGLEVVTGPVVCGPVGFRQVPLQSRWGEYVRVTVTAPSALRGTVLVHANGVAQEARPWSADSAGALIVEARFPNESVERPFALERERPIDITLTGLEALGGGTCEGAVFTVEHGALVPSIEERAWIAELERRGGPELAARREAARVEADARRQAHYAQWEARRAWGGANVSAEVIAVAPAADPAASVATATSGGVVRSGAVAGTQVGASGESTGVSPRSPLGENGRSSVAPVVAVTSPAEWSQPSDASLRVTAEADWVQPPEVQLRASAAVESSWVQPFEPRLQPVAVTTESRVATASTQTVVTPSCHGECEAPVDPGLSALVPALFQLLFNVASAASPQPPHAAQPVPPGGR